MIRRAVVPYPVIRVASFVVLVSALAQSASSQVSATITSDNAYSFGWGDINGIASANYQGGVTNLSAGAIYNCPGGPEAYTIPSPSNDDYFYIVAWSDDATRQGVLGQFSYLSSTVVTGVGPWQVYATGQDFDTFLSPSPPLDGPPGSNAINAQIAIANANGGTPGTTSVGWVGVAGGLAVAPATGSGMSAMPCMNPTARWMWYNASPGTITNPFTTNPGAGGHQEYLIFRLPMATVLCGTCIPAPDDLIGWWPLDETTPGTVEELIAGLNGVGMGSPLPSPVPGMVANGLHFDGHYQGSVPQINHVSVDDNVMLDLGTGDFTIDAWVQWDWPGCDAPLVSKGASRLSKNKFPNDIGFEWGLRACHPGYPTSAYLSLSSGPGQKSIHSYGAALTDGLWHHLAVVVQRTGPNPIGVTFYDNGVAFPDTSGTLPITSTLTTTEPLSFGRYGGGAQNVWDDQFTGNLDEIEIFNRALEPGEVLALYLAGPGGKCKDGRNGGDFLEGLSGNNTCESSVTLPPLSFANLTVSKNNADWYHISVPAGGTLTVDVLFLNAFGNINIALRAGWCGGFLGIAQTTNDGEHLTWTNTSNSAKDVNLVVYMPASSDLDCNTYGLSWFATSPQWTDVERIVR